MSDSNAIDDILYPAIEPNSICELKVSDLHTIVYEEAGNPLGRPALFLHGGPGVGIMPGYRRFFDPQHYRQVLVDQRGAGRSTPHAEITDNTTWHIIEDLEKLRSALGIDNWIVMGGSWGSLLALCYAITHPASVAGIIIRGVFLGRRTEVDWIHKPHGAAQVFPDEWERYVEPVAGADDIVAAYCERLASDDTDTALAAARAWSRWEGSMNAFLPDPDTPDAIEDASRVLPLARIESHFTRNGFFLESDNFVLDNAAAIAHIPCYMVNGRFDLICPSASAWELHKALPASTLTIVQNGAHSPLDPGMAAELVKAADRFRKY